MEEQAWLTTHKVMDEADVEQENSVSLLSGRYYIVHIDAEGRREGNVRQMFMLMKRENQQGIQHR